MIKFINNKARPIQVFHCLKFNFCDFRHKTIAELMEIKRNKPDNSAINEERKEKFDLLYLFLKNNKPISLGLISVFLCIKEFFFFSFLFGSYSLYQLLKINSNYIRVLKHTEDTFTNEKKPDINYAMEEICKYIYNHPDLKIYYNKDNSLYFMTTWGILDKFGLNKHYRTDYTLHDKRYVINSHIILENTESECLYIWAYVLFFTPTHFKIEYLRVKREGVIPEKVYTIIDGSRHGYGIEYDTEDLEYVNTRVFPKYRKPDNTDYNI